jgi:hypothetical protein
LQLAFDSDSDGEDDEIVTKPLKQLTVTDGTSSSSSAAGINGGSSGTDASSSAQQLQVLQRETEELKAAVAHWKGRAESSAKLITELTKEVTEYVAYLALYQYC